MRMLNSEENAKEILLKNKYRLSLTLQKSMTKYLIKNRNMTCFPNKTLVFS